MPLFFKRFRPRAHVFIAVTAIFLVAGCAGGWGGAPPTDLGVIQGRLKPPSVTDNSVSSQAALYPDHPQRAYAQIDPLTYRGDGRIAMQRLVKVLSAWPDTALITQRPDYLHAACQTRWLRFTDDVEFWLDESAQRIHVRSASRVGRKDFGANRQRVEALRAAFAASTS